MRRCLAAAAAALALGGCNLIDSVLESDPVIKLAMTADSGLVTIPQGSTKSLRTRVTPTGDVLKSAISISAEKVPAGFTVVIDSVISEGTSTTGRVKIDVGLTAPLGAQEVRLLGKAARANNGGFLVRVNVVPPSVIAVSLAKATITIARGGMAPITTQLVRTSFPIAVTFALDGAPSGITATFDEAGTTANAATASLVVASSVAPGQYTMQVRASGIGVADATTPLTVNVTADPLQLIADLGIETPQATSASRDFVINRGDGVGVVTLTAENVPAGVVATFDATVTSNATGRITLAAGGTVPAGDYAVTIRAQATGVADATTIVPLKVLDASVALGVTPATIEVLQGQSTQVSLALARTLFTGSIAISVTALPTGVTATALPVNVIGTSATVTFLAASSAPAGTYDVNINATPAGLGASKIRTVVVKVTVRAVPTGANVVLDWTGCTVPTWIAAQNGTGAWQRIFPVGNQAGFLVSLGRGGYAWNEGNSVFVKYALQNDLTSKPIQMCPAAAIIGTKTITGIGVHTQGTESWSYLLGGGSGVSTGTSPAFSILGVQDGTHDLVAFGQTVSGFRGLIRRDLNLANGSALDPVELTSTEGFGLVPRNLTTTIGLLAGESLSYNYNYLTTPACVENRIAAGAGSTVQTLNTFPEDAQRAGDFHEYAIAAISPAGTRSVSVAFRTSANRTVAMPVTPTAANVFTQLNQNMMQLRASVTSIPIQYNGTISLSYRQGTQSNTVSATTAYTGLTNINLIMPEFLGMSGFDQAWVIPSGSLVLWRLSFDGANLIGPRCTEGRTAVSYVRTGQS
jgi:hypothetical protein